MRTRTGKIARLPERIREELNQRLFNGARGKDMPAWLNELPEVRQTLAEFFNGRPITEHNVSEWRTGGYGGLLHDFDYERYPTPPDHPLKGSEILRAKGYPEDVIYAIKSHADYLVDCPRISLLDKTLYACDELSGFITACAKVRPEGIVGMKASSVKKKLKAKGFAAAVNRDDITRGAADLGVALDEHIQFVVDALAANGAALDLLPPTSQ